MPFIMQFPGSWQPLSPHYAERDLSEERRDYSLLLPTRGSRLRLPRVVDLRGEIRRIITFKSCSSGCVIILLSGIFIFPFLL